MTDQFLPGDDSHLEQIQEDKYEQILADNPLLIRHPDYVKEVSHNTRDFIVKEEAEEPATQALEQEAPRETEQAAQGPILEASMAIEQKEASEPSISDQ